MNYEALSETNGSCSIDELEHEHKRGLDLGPNSDDKETLNMSGESSNSGENVDVSLVYGSGSNSQDLNNHLTSSELVDDNMVSKVESKEAEVSSPNATASSKGKGLKKWRRIKRDIRKDASTRVDPIEMLKRGYSNVNNMNQQLSDVSVSSTNAIFQAPVESSSSSYNLPVNTVFSSGVDSENSEDRSSKSSTAASAPKYRCDAFRALGHQRNKHKVKSVGGKNTGVGDARSLGSKVLSVCNSSKKARGGNVDVEKENSLSSMESDSRSYNSVFVRGNNCVTSDPTKSGRPTNDDDVDDDDEPGSEEHSVEEVRSDCSKDRSVSQESSSDGNKGESKNHDHPRDCDPLVNSIMMLRSAQAALEKEVHEFGKIGKGIHSFCEDTCENSSMSRGPEVCTYLAFDGSGAESDHIYSNIDVQTLERRLGEAEVMLKEKESKIIELETTRSISPLKDVESTRHQLLKKTEEMEAELETFFKQKVEAEIEYVAMTGSNKELSALVENQMTLLKEQTTLVTEIAKSSRTAEDVKNKAIKLRGQLKDISTFYDERTESEEIETTRRRIIKLTKCLIVQLILLFLALRPFLSQLSPESEVFVPT